MTDIISTDPGLDLGVFDTQTERAKNILSVQLGALEYASDLGIDLAFFLSDAFSFENEAFKSYVIEMLANRGINIATLDDSVFGLYRKYTFNLTPDQNSTGLIAR